MSALSTKAEGSATLSTKSSYKADFLGAVLSYPRPSAPTSLGEQQGRVSKELRLTAQERGNKVTRLHS